jgi:tetraacyldisaccharide 4'-kinase
MKYFRFIFFPFAVLYWIITSFRNVLFNIGFFNGSKFSIPIINVGNLSMGGTGKTPHTEYLIRLLKDKYKVATLSRGFGRKERGFIIANEDSTALQIGDEPMQYFTKFSPSISVVVDANRVTGVMDLCREKPETQVVLLDDAFQHRAIKAGLNILITTAQEPYFKDFILPVGNLRESRRGAKRADIIIVSKNKELKTLNKDYYRKKIKLKDHQSLFFSKVDYGAFYSLKDKQIIDAKIVRNLIVVTGIARSESLIDHLKSTHTILHHFNYKDHHNFKAEDIDTIHNLFGKFAEQKPLIVTTEKDAMRLMQVSFTDKTAGFPWVYQSIEIELDEPAVFDEIIMKYVEENS